MTLVYDRPEFSDTQVREIRKCGAPVDVCVACGFEGVRVVSAGLGWLVECELCGRFDRLSDEDFR